MANAFSYAGNVRVGAYVEDRMAEIGWTRVDESLDADVAFTYCVSMAQLEDAFFEGNAIMDSMKSDGMVVDLSPSTPSFAREVSALCSVNGIRFIEAPISVDDPDSPDAFSSSDGITCYVAGNDDDVEAALPILNALAANVEHVGAAGMGALAKAVTTVQYVAHLLADVESEALLSAATASSVAGGWTTMMTGEDNAYPAEVQAFGSGSGYAGAFTVEMLLGEVAAALEAAEDLDLVMPQLDACMSMLELLALVGGIDMAPRAISLMYCNEETGAAEGLDWKRAKEIYSEGHEHDHDGVDVDFDSEIDDWGMGYDDPDDGPFGAVYGRYSSN